MKRNIIAISLMAAGLFTFGNVYAEDNAEKQATACEKEKYTYQATLSDGTYLCGGSLSGLINDESFDGGEITFLKSVTFPSDSTITKDVTINLNKNTLDVSNNSIVVKGANLTIKNGTITTGASSTNSIFNIKSTTDEASLTIEDNVKVNSTTTTLGAAIHIEDSTNNKITVNVNGKWTIPGEIVDCQNGDEDGNIIVNLNANVTTTGNNILTINAGTSTVNVLGGSYTSQKDTIELTDGTLNISGGKIISNGGHTVAIKVSTKQMPKALNITGGEIVAKASGYAISFAENTADGEYSFSGGIYTSGKKGGKNLPAFIIKDANFLEEQSGIITGGTYNHGIVGDVQVGTAKYRPAASAISMLLGSDVTATTDDKGNVVVTTPAKTEEPTNPEQTGSQAGSDNGTGDNTLDDSPQTYDGIMSYVTMAITSVGAVALSLKKVLSR